MKGPPGNPDGTALSPRRVPRRRTLLARLRPLHPTRPHSHIQAPPGPSAETGAVLEGRRGLAVGGRVWLPEMSDSLEFGDVQLAGTRKSA